MSTNKKVMSIAIHPDLHDELKKLAKRKGMSASTYIGNLVDQAVKLPNPDDDPIVIGKPSDEEVISLVLKIPVAIKNNSEKLNQWLEVQKAGILEAMAKPSKD